MERTDALRMLIDNRYDGRVVDFARAIKRAPSQVHQWLGGHRRLGDASARHIEITLDLGIGWFDHPDTPAPTPPSGASEPDRLRPAPPDTRLIPVISYIHAGHPAEAVDAYVQGEGFDQIAVDADMAQMLGPYAFALSVEGNSMAPEYQPGDVVVIDPDSPVRPGDAVVAKLDADDAATLKKYRDRGRATDGTPIIELVPLNDDYPTLVMDAANPGRLIGPVIEHRRRRRRE